MLYGSEGVVLRQSDLGEYDKVVSVFTQDHGLVNAVVKGTRRPKSRLSSVTQPFSRAVFQFYRGRTLDRVTQVMLLTSHPKISSDYGKAIYANYLAELTMGIVPEREENQGQYLFFLKVLSCLEQTQDPWPVVRWAELGLLARAGFGAVFDECQACGKSLGDSPLFSPSRGGPLCGECTRAPGDFAVSPGALRTIALLSEDAQKGSLPLITARGQVKEEVGHIMGSFTHYVLGRRLKSLSLVENMERDGF